ncbi:MAG: hypothetical protein ACYDHX_13690 [Methanothrix sp.]
MSQITGNSGSLNSIVEFGNWRINQNADGTWQGNLELPNDKFIAISKYKSGQPLMAKFYKGSDTYEGQITIGNTKRDSIHPMGTVQFKGNSKLEYAKRRGVSR